MSSLPQRWLPWLRVAVAPASVAAASLLQAAAKSPIISDRPYMLLFGAVLATGWFSGIGPALLASALAAVSGFFWLYPASGGTAPYFSLCWFLGFSLVLAAALDSWRRALERASTALEQLRAHERELEAAKDAAEVANRAKSRFFATVSHELNTPVERVIAASSALLESSLASDQRELARQIRAASGGLLALVNDVLDFSRLESGRVELEHQSIVLRECVESVIEQLAPSAVAKGLSLRHSIEVSAPAAVVGDGARLRQILVHVIGNAIQFTERGEVELSVAARAIDERAGDTRTPSLWELRFAVRDTGVGIPLDRRGELFQSFSRLDASGARRGSGLGLAISRALAEAMGGTIWLESEGVPGRGSTFYFTVRARSADGALKDADC